MPISGIHARALARAPYMNVNTRVMSAWIRQRLQVEHQLRMLVE